MSVDRTRFHPTQAQISRVFLELDLNIFAGSVVGQGHQFLITMCHYLLSPAGSLLRLCTANQSVEGPLEKGRNAPCILTFWMCLTFG